MTRRGTLALAVFLSIAAPGRTQEPDPLRAGGPWIVDSEDRVVILHGVNASSGAKRPPFEPDLAEGDPERLARLGFTVVRLLVVWVAVEPERDRYDEAYLERLAGHVDRLGRAGVRVVLDMHQDLYSRHLFGGDGAPAWAVEKLPFEPRSPWFANYSAPAVQANFDRFWTSEDLVERFALAWERVARRLGPHPAVIGYDLLNEPHPGTAAPGAFEPDRYVPWLAKLADRLQAITPDRIVFVEPMALNPTRGDLYASLAGPRRVFAPHWYDPVVEATGEFRSSVATRLAVGLIRRRGLDAGFPVLFGEWGVVQRAGGAVDYVRLVADLFDQHRVGWCWWAWDREDGRGFGLVDARGELAPAGRWLVRAYPSRVAGVPDSWRSDPESGTFDFAWRPSAGVTEIVLPAGVFGPRGGRVAGSAGVEVLGYDPARATLRVRALPGAEACRIDVRRE